MKLSKHSNSQGFTLIELMATMVVMMILLVTGGATYLRFQERQDADKVATELQRFVVKTRAKARSQDKEGCSSASVVGYSLRFNQAANRVENVGFCGDGKYTAVPDTVVDTYAIPAPVDIEFDSTPLVQDGSLVATKIIHFYSLTGGATVPAPPGPGVNPRPVDIEVSRGGATHKFTISPGGEVSGVIKL